MPSRHETLVRTIRKGRNTYYRLVPTFFRRYIRCMMKGSLFQIRIAEVDRSRWHQAAESAGMPLAEYVRLAVEDRIASSEVDELRNRIARALAELEGRKP